MKFFVFLIGIAVGGVAVWLYCSNPNTVRQHPTGESAESSAQSAGNAIRDKLQSLHLNSDEIKDELNRTGQVIRQNAEQAGQKIADATADARITAAIKAKLVGDPDLSAWDISVNTTDGIVTLSGSVSNADQIGKAVLLALEADGVKRVISTLQVKQPH
ncbi:MAG: BON domain-containing protein [Verrucomicrobiota bacterium]